MTDQGGEMMYRSKDEFVRGQKIKLVLIVLIMLTVRLYSGVWLP